MYNLEIVRAQYIKRFVLHLVTFKYRELFVILVIVLGFKLIKRRLIYISNVIHIQTTAKAQKLVLLSGRHVA